MMSLLKPILISTYFIETKAIRKKCAQKGPKVNVFGPIMG
jgi:hypothetical protein